MRTILIVDDEEYVRKFVMATLRKLDFQIVQADSSEEALTIAGDMVPDLILMDIILPGEMDGIEIAKVLKENPKTAACPVVLMSGKITALDRDNDGVDGFLPKPFKPNDLRNIIECTLGAA